MESLIYKLIIMLVFGAILLVVGVQYFQSQQNLREIAEANAMLEVVQSKMVAVSSVYGSSLTYSFTLFDEVAGHKYTLEVIPSGNSTTLKVQLDNGQHYSLKTYVEVAPFTLYFTHYPLMKFNSGDTMILSKSAADTSTITVTGGVPGYLSNYVPPPPILL